MLQIVVKYPLSLC